MKYDLLQGSRSQGAFHISSPSTTAVLTVEHNLVPQINPRGGSMSARHFDHYFDDLWKTEVLECPKCHWLGTFEQGTVEYFDQLMDCHCPRCSSLEAPMLAIVSYPTLEELRAN
jgi:hypothetical protein